MALHDTPTAGNQILRALARHPDRVAFSGDAGTLTYRATTERIGRMQKILLSLCLEPGSTVAVLSSNKADAWCAGSAAHLSRFPTTWLHPQGSLEDHLFQLEDSAARVLVVDPASFGDRGGELAARAASLHTVLTLGPASYGTNLVAAVDSAGSATPRCTAVLDDPATLVYTGGTTGRPKAVLRLHRQYSHLAPATLMNFEFPEQPQYLAVGPISHAAGLNILPALMRGGTVHLATGFDPEKVLDTVQRQRIDTTMLVPTMIYTLLDHPALSRSDTSSLELLIYGASPMSPSRLAEGIERFGPVFSQLYAQSECTPIAVLAKSEHDPARPDRLLSCGHPALGCGVRLLDADGQDVELGAPGEICVRGAQAMTEYWNQPKVTDEAVRDGWLHTGDIARADEEGYLYILDRKKDMIVTGGFNVYPKEVEDVLAAHPDVAVVAVVGVPHDKWGEAVTAVVVPRVGARIDEQELTGLVRQRKGPVHAPKEIRVVDELPLTAVGKVDKKALKETFWNSQDRRVG